jgi:hypothetical protein
VDLDSKLSGRCPDALPRGIALGVCHALDLVESRNRVAHVARVVDWLLALLREGESLGRHSVALTRAQCSTLPRCHVMASFLDEMSKRKDRAGQVLDTALPAEG